MIQKTMRQKYKGTPQRTEGHRHVAQVALREEAQGVQRLQRGLAAPRRYRAVRRGDQALDPHRADLRLSLQRKTCSTTSNFKWNWFDPRTSKKKNSQY